MRFLGHLALFGTVYQPGDRLKMCGPGKHIQQTAFSGLPSAGLFQYFQISGQSIRGTGDVDDFRRIGIDHLPEGGSHHSAAWRVNEYDRII